METLEEKYKRYIQELKDLHRRFEYSRYNDDLASKIIEKQKVIRTMEEMLASKEGQHDSNPQS